MTDPSESSPLQPPQPVFDELVHEQTERTANSLREILDEIKSTKEDVAALRKGLVRDVTMGVLGGVLPVVAFLILWQAMMG